MDGRLDGAAHCLPAQRREATPAVALERPSRAEPSRLTNLRAAVAAAN